MAIAMSLLNHLHDHATPYQLLQHKATGCSRDSAYEAKVPEDHLAKAVLLKDEQSYLLAVIPADSWLQLKRLSQKLGRQLELASETELRLMFSDCLPGAVPALGKAYEIDTVVDEDLATLSNVYMEGGDHQTLIALSGSEFRLLMQGVRYGHFCHRH